jgi:hypothetical protein
MDISPDIRISRENALKILEILGEVTDGLETVMDCHWSDEGISGETRSMEEILHNPIAKAIWRIADVFEILDEPLKIPE